MGNLSVITFSTPGQKNKGLQNMSPIPADTLFVFTGVSAGTQFHSKNVREPFDIIFTDTRGEILEAATLVPEDATIMAPPNTAYAIEAKEGELEKRSMEVGRVVNINNILGK